MALNKKSPEVRFDGFTRDWEEIPFSKLFVGISNNSLSRDKLNKSSGLAKNIHYGDILVKFGEVVDVQRESLPYISDDEFVEKNASSKLIDGDIIFADAAEDITVGKCIELENIKDDTVLAGLHTIAARPQKQFSSKYLGYYLNSKTYHNQLIRLMQGTKVLSISKTSIRDTMIKYPKDKAEQKKVGTLFSQIDVIIKNHQTHLTKLKNLKSAMLVKMFPQEGNNVPEIRFKGFSGEWELFPFKTLAKCRRGLTYSPSDTRNKGIKVLRSSNIDNDTFLEQDDDVYVKKEAINIDFIKEGDILITAANGSSRLVGKHAIVEVLKNKAVHGGFMLIAETNVPYFLNASMSSTWYSRFLKQNIAGGNGAIGNLKGNSLEEYLIKIPKEDEQIKIGEYFKNLDSLISNQKEQLNKLQNIKKALLDKLFVN